MLTKEEFELLDAVEQRKAIANDIIELVNSNRLIPQPGVWIEFKEKEVDKFKVNHSVSKLFKEKKLSKCEVCGVGAVMLAMLLYKNQVYKDDLVGNCMWYHTENINTSRFLDKVRALFDKSQLTLIEAAFERGNLGLSSIHITPYQKEMAIRFGRRYPNSNERMIAIFEHIIKSKDGKFYPGVKYN